MNGCDQLKSIIGSFEQSEESKKSIRLWSLMLLILVPVIVIYALYDSLSTSNTLNFDQIAIIIVAFSSFGLGFFLWRSTFRIWVFTESEISAKIKDKILWAVKKSTISSCEIKNHGHGILWLHFVSEQKKYAVLIVPELFKKLTT